MKVFALLLGFILWTSQASAQTYRDGEITVSPLCSKLTNRSEQTMIGTLSTAPQKITSGDMVKHRNNFRIPAGESMDFCSTGPFFEGRRLEIVLRTLIPLFDCKTKIDREIFLDTSVDRYGVKSLSATCE